MNTHARTLIEALVESPMLVGDDDFGLVSDRHNAEMLARLEPGASLVAQVGETRLYRGKHAGMDAYFASDSAGRQLTFFVAVVDEEVEGLGPASVQVALWRGPGAERGLPGKVFWEVIVPRTGTAVSDISQTQDGRTFWRDRILESLAKPGVTAGMVDTATGRRFPIYNRQDYLDLRDAAYSGTDKSKANLRFYIQQ